MNGDSGFSTVRTPKRKNGSFTIANRRYSSFIGKYHIYVYQCLRYDTRLKTFISYGIYVESGHILIWRYNPNMRATHGNAWLWQDRFIPNRVSSEKNRKDSKEILYAFSRECTNPFRNMAEKLVSYTKQPDLDESPRKAVVTDNPGALGGKCDYCGRTVDFLMESPYNHACLDCFNNFK